MNVVVINNGVNTGRKHCTVLNTIR